jgi:glycosyltransferase involved in cell wall biosynthesis
MGTSQLGMLARQTHRAPVWVLEPPIDTSQDHPAIDGAAFRRRHRIAEDEMLIVSVSRLAIDLKLDALVRAIDAVSSLAGRFPVRLVLVGEGAAGPSLAQRAAYVNGQWAREVVTLAGSLLDPREAYAAADVVVGMGSSSMRALAIGRPVIVQGERGYSEIFGPDTVATFLHQGFFGVGSNDAGASRLAAQLEVLLKHREYAKSLGQYGHEVISGRLSLRRAIPLQMAIYDETRNARWSSPASATVTAAMRAIMLELSNHNPHRKRRSAKFEARLLAAARNGTWPSP